MASAGKHPEGRRWTPGRGPVDNDGPPEASARVGPSARRVRQTVAGPTRGSRTVAAVILAAGKGKRMRSARPKVLHDVCGKPGLWHVVRAAMAARPSGLVIVVGHGKEEVEEAVRSWDLPVEVA